MRARNLLAGSCVVAAIGSALACASKAPTSGPGAYDAPAPTLTAPAATAGAPVADAAPSSPAACDLAASGVQFSAAACGTCMQASCCAVTKTCFVDAPECAALYECLNACPSRGLEPDAGTGLDGAAASGDGGGEAGADAGDPCVDACNAQHPGEVGAARDYIRCYAGNCRTPCQ